jgi:pimeloyl-ACP methyl ester carboxylesterase
MSPISKPYVTRVAPRYPEIKAPTVIITGDSDSVVLAHIHSEGLARDIEGRNSSGSAISATSPIM